MPLSAEQEALCERLEKGESTPTAASLIRQQAHEIDDLWDRLSRAYALVRNESPAEMMQEEMKELHAMLEGRRTSQTRDGGSSQQISQGKPK
jgi:rubrerythrin